MDWKLWTDGAARPTNPGPAAAAYLLTNGVDAAHQGGQPLGMTTNNVAELEAIRLGVGRAGELLQVGDNLTILSDSTYALGVIAGTKVARKHQSLITRIQADVEALDICLKPGEIRFEHVKGHAGCPENEAVDRLATRLASEQPELLIIRGTKGTP